MSRLLGPSYFLTRDIRASDVLAVEIDQYNPKCVIITSKESIKLYDPHSRTITKSWVLKSWRTPSSACVNNSKGTFFCLTDSKHLLSWNNITEELDNTKLLKFFNNIVRLKSYNGQVYAVFAGGFVEEITSAIEHRKETKPLLVKADYRILSVAIVEDAVILSSCSSSAENFLPEKLHHYVIGSSCTEDVSTYAISRPGVTLLGVGVTSHSIAVTLWSNGELCTSTVGALPPALQQESIPLHVQVVAEWSDCVQCSVAPVIVLQCSSRHVAIIGHHPTEDGGIVSVWDTDLFVEVSRRAFKLYTQNMNCWAARHALLLHEQRCISVIPILQLPPAGVQQLFSANYVEVLGEDEPIIRSNWATKGPINGITKIANTSHKSLKAAVKSTTVTIDSLIETLKLKTLDEALCCEMLCNYAVENKNVLLVCELVASKKQLSEHCIVKLLRFVLETGDDVFGSDIFDCKVHLIKKGHLQKLLEVSENERQASRTKQKRSSLGKKKSKRRSSDSASIVANSSIRCVVAGDLLDLTRDESIPDSLCKITFATFSSEAQNKKLNGDTSDEETEGKIENEEQCCLPLLSSRRNILINILLTLSVHEELLLNELCGLHLQQMDVLMQHLTALLPYNLMYLSKQLICSLSISGASYSVQLIPSIKSVCLWLSALYDARNRSVTLQPDSQHRNVFSSLIRSVTARQDTLADAAITGSQLMQDLLFSRPTMPQQNSGPSSEFYSIEKITFRI